MKKLFIILIAVLSLSMSACHNDTERGDAVTDAPEENINIDDIVTYKNPIIKVNDKDAWPDYGVGDPFVMRWNGRYYLYCSTKDGEVGIQCWISDDLVNWRYSGLCATEALTMSAYAPEVVYYNGYFYMYTSPAGNGHYVLKSSSPTGPFVAVTDNFGLSIDGNIFIDDDGSWHFYSAAQGGIMVYPMTAPDKVDASAGKKIALDMHGWTEGSMIVKHNGAYYMTYTGNHVWTDGYRINYALGTSPIDFTPAENNPLLLSTDKNTVKGIGHSSIVLGPNLDEYYIVYHSYKQVPQRDMNIDRIIFNGNNTLVLGPTVTKQQAPVMPDIYSYFEDESELSGWNVTNGGFKNGRFTLYEGEMILSKESLEGDFTAEYNLKSISDKAGIVFGYKDEKNYASATYDVSEKVLAVSFVTNGKVSENRVPISASFSDELSGNALILFRVQKYENEYTFFVNNREVLNCEVVHCGGSIGVICEKGSALVGFVGGTNGVIQSTLADVYKPIESTIPAYLCTDRYVATSRYDDGIYLSAVSGARTYEYKTNVADNGNYDIVIEYRSEKASTYEIYQDSVKVGEISLPSTAGELSRVTGRNMSLHEGNSVIAICVKEGSADLLSFYFHRAYSAPKVTYDFKRSMSFYHKDGDWCIKDEALVLEDEFGKYMVGSENWGDYIVETDITPTSDSINCGVCVRVSNPTTFLEGRIPEGSDYLQGYFIGLGNGSIVLGKHNYDWKELKRVNFNIEKGETYHLRVEVNESILRISIDGESVMVYNDVDSPFLHGMVGYRAHASSMSADNLTIYPID